MSDLRRQVGVLVTAGRVQRDQAPWASMMWPLL